jgi:hypothetical protein
MKDYQTALEKLRWDVAQAALVRDLATLKVKRDMLERLHQHCAWLADEVEQEVKRARARH